uniref:Uncharacterized protein n=1 Tax=Anguilla anguilla TaxID=7936 RepID=A0A0E9Q2T8_ANGAN
MCKGCVCDVYMCKGSVRDVYMCKGCACEGVGVLGDQPRLNRG